jgi:hypothetical protein
MLPRDPSSLFAVLYRILRWYWVNFFLGTLLIFIHKRISVRSAQTQSLENCIWLVKSLGQKRLQLGVPNLPAVEAESNAEEWCSAVDTGGKKDFFAILERDERSSDTKR